MKVYLVGLQPLDFVGRDSNLVKGINLHCIFFGDERVYGQCADSKFLSDIVLTNLGLNLDDLKPLINHYLDLEVNFKGKVVGISLIEDSGVNNV